jgi:hypothetical protein
MISVFTRLYDTALSSKVPQAAPVFGRELQNATQQFLAVARRFGDENKEESLARSRAQAPDSDVDDDDDDDDADDDDETSPVRGPQLYHKGSTSPEATAQHGQSRRQQTQLYGGIIMTEEPYEDVPVTTTYAPATSAVATSGYEVVAEPTLDNASFPFGMSLGYGGSGGLLDLGPITDGSMIALANSVSPHSLLANPPSYAYQERTFGRRLQRVALEQGLALIQMPNPPPHLYAGIFGFCLLFEPRQKIVERLTNCISMNYESTLCNWKYPFVNLGGAGTFFDALNTNTDFGDISALSELESRTGGRYLPPNLPVGNQGTREEFRPLANTGFSVGPWNSDVEETRDMRVDRKLRITVPGFEGDFFDCDEVEFYLRQRGITIPPAADFVTSEIDVNDFPTDDNGSSPARAGSLDSEIVSLDALNRGGSLSTASLSGLVTPNAGSVDPWPQSVQSPAEDVASLTSLDATLDLNLTSDIMASISGVTSSSLVATSSALLDSGILTTATTTTSLQPPVSVKSTKKVITINVAVLVHGKSSISHIIPPATSVYMSIYNIYTHIIPVFITDQLSTELIMRSVCLGRSPGIRPKDVNTALWLSTNTA